MNKLTFEDLDNYLLAIDRSKTFDEIIDTLQKQINFFGFERFTYWLRWANSDDRKPVFISTYPQKFIDHYVANDFQTHDMVGRFSTKTNTPFKWTDISNIMPITKIQNALFDDSRSTGLKSGGSVPIHGPNGTQATFSVASDIEAKEFDQLFLKHRHELHIIATYAHEKIMALGLDSEASNTSLTARETEILTWVARGKTYWEIGSILKIQEDTVKKHMQRIFRLLHVHNNTHAVTKAIINGLIIP